MADRRPAVWQAWLTVTCGSFAYIEYVALSKRTVPPLSEYLNQYVNSRDFRGKLGSGVFLGFWLWLWLHLLRFNNEKGS